MTKKILYVDDLQLGSKPLITALQDIYGFSITHVDSAEEVMSKLENSRFAAIILDVMMPIPPNWTQEEINDADDGRYTGLVLLNKIRSKHMELPILIYSSGEVNLPNDKYCCYLRRPELTKNIADKLTDLIKLR